MLFLVEKKGTEKMENKKMKYIDPELVKIANSQLRKLAGNIGIESMTA